MYHVCLDPGHGPNCANRSPDGRYEEQEFAMDLANRIAAILKRHGVQVSLTRTEREYPSLNQRCRVANGIPQLSLFVSLHSNAAAGGGWSEAAGHMAFTSSAGSMEKRNLAARAILEEWERAGIPIRGAGLFHYGYGVLTGTKAPAVLLEHGFHTNRKETELLKSPAFRSKLAEADANGILAFLGLPWRSGAKDRERVKERFGLAEETLDYLEAYRYGSQLLSKLAEMR